MDRVPAKSSAKKAKRRRKLRAAVRALVVLALLAAAAYIDIHPARRLQAFQLFHRVTRLGGEPPGRTVLGFPGDFRPRYDNLPLGVPQGGGVDFIVDRPGFCYGWSAKAGQPRWVAYRLTREEVYARRRERPGSFTADPAVPFSGYLLSLYGDSGYSRGHHAPAADMAYSDETMADSFRASNISPQNLALNRAFWSDVEREVRHIATRAKAALVVTGPVLPAEGGARLGFLGPVVPEGFFKVVLPEGAPRASATAFLVPNADVAGPVKEYVATLDEVERATGLRLFPGASLP